MALTIIFIIAIAVFLIWIYGTPNGYVKKLDNFKMEFESFKKFYYLNPDRYELKKDNVKLIKVKHTYPYEFYEYDGNIYFSLLDTWKYRRWCNQLSKSEAKEAELQMQLKYLELVKLDIVNVEKLAELKAYEAKDILSTVLNKRR